MAAVRRCCKSTNKSRSAQFFDITKVDMYPLLLFCVIFGLTQGATEFLPISSSGHLALVWATFEVMGWSSPGSDPLQRIAFEVAAHLGTLAAVTWALWSEVKLLAKTGILLLTGRWTQHVWVLIYLILGTLPLILIVLIPWEMLVSWTRITPVVALATIGFGLLLGWVDKRAAREEIERENRDMPTVRLTTATAILIGGTQIVAALIPGTSRAGITMTAARWVGIGRIEATKFSMLLAIPAIAGAGLVSLSDITDPSLLVVMWFPLLCTFALSLGSGFIAIRILIGMVSRMSFLPFVWYRVALGTALLTLWLVGVLP